MLDPQERALNARIAVLARWGRTPDREAATRKAREAQLTRFERAVREEFPDLDNTSVAKLADARKRAHYLRMAKLSAEARKAKRSKGSGRTT